MTTATIRIALPQHLRVLAHVDREVQLPVAQPVTQAGVLDALEEHYPVLRGTIRHHHTHQRRSFIRFFGCKEDLSHEGADAQLPDAIASGTEPFMIVGAVAGG